MSRATDDFFRFRTGDPDHFAEALAPIVPHSRSIHPFHSAGFSAAIKAIKLRYLGLFSVRLENARVLDSEPSGFCCVNVPLSNSFETVQNGCKERFEPGSAHILNGDEAFDLRVAASAEVLVADFDMRLLEAYAAKLNGGETLLDTPLHFRQRLSLATVEGADFWRHLSFIWGELNRGSALLKSPRVVEELEHFLLAALFYATDPSAARREERGAHPACLSRAEDYIDARLHRTLSVADIAEAAGVNARTLFRAFKQRHGTGPIGFLKQRRLEAAQRALLAAEPVSATVTEIALRYGFHHLGRFAADYRRAFGESPAETLRR